MKRGLILIIFLLMFLVGCTSYSLTGNSVYTGKVVSAATVKVTSNIVGARVYFDNKYSGDIGSDYTYTKSGLNPGKHLLEVKGNYEYDPIKHNVILKAGETKEENIELKKKAKLFISSSVIGADVFLNYEYKGKTPVTIPYLSHGTNYYVQVKKNWYITFNSYKKVFRGETAKVHAILQPLSSSSLGVKLKTGSLDAVSNPDGATVFVDGVDMGITGVTVGGLVSGLHEVKISKQGYRDYTTTIDITDNKVAPLNVELQPLDSLIGSLYVLTNPPGTGVYVNYVLKCTTQVEQASPDYGSCTVNNLDPGNYDVKLSKQSYIDELTAVTIVGGQTTTVNKALNLAFGTLKVTASTTSGIINPVKSASVFVDGIYKGKIPATSGTSFLTLSEVNVGNRYVRVFRSGFIDKTISVNIVGGETITLDCNTSGCVTT